MDGTIATNNHPRDLLWISDLTPSEQEEFGYLHPVHDDGQARFVRAYGSVWDVYDTVVTSPEGFGAHGWDSVYPTSAFSATLFRLIGPDQVVVGRWWS